MGLPLFASSCLSAHGFHQPISVCFKCSSPSTDRARPPEILSNSKESQIATPLHCSIAALLPKVAGTRSVILHHPVFIVYLASTKLLLVFSNITQYARAGCGRPECLLHSCHCRCHAFTDMLPCNPAMAKSGAQRKRARRARDAQANAGAQASPASQATQDAQTTQARGTVGVGQAAEAPASGESAIGTPCLVPAPERKPRKPRWTKGHAQANSSARFEGSSDAELTTGSLGPSLSPKEQSPTLTAPSQGVTAGDFRSAIFQAAPGHSAPSPYYYAQQAQSSLEPTPPLSGDVVLAPKSSSSSLRVESSHNTSRLKRNREDDDDTRNTPTKYARLETQVLSGSHNTQYNGSHGGALCQPTGNPSTTSQIGHVHVKQESTHDSSLPRSPHQTGLQSALSLSNPPVCSPVIRPSPGGSSPVSHQSSTPGTAGSSLASLQDLCDPDTLQVLLDAHGEAAFQVVRSLTGKMLDHFSSKKKKFSGTEWRRSAGPSSADRREEAGNLIRVPIVVQRGNRRPPQDRDMWWNEGLAGTVHMIKFVVALIVYNAKRCKKLMILTTRHDSNIAELRERGQLQDYVHVTRYPEEEHQPNEPCRGRLRFTTYSHALKFAWKGPRFLDTESTYDYPHGLLYQPLGELCDSDNLKYFHQIIKNAFSEMETQLAFKCEQAMAREEWERRNARPDTPQQSESPTDNGRHLPEYEEDTALAALSPVCAHFAGPYL